MITPETRVQIRRYFYAEHWKIGTIAQTLDVHPDTVRRAIEVERFQHAEPLRASILDPFLPFVRQTLEQYPRLRATWWPACAPNRAKPSCGCRSFQPRKPRLIGPALVRSW